MASSGYLGNLGNLGLSTDRFMANQPAPMYDPNQFINPMMLPYLQPQLMKQMENFQNPALMLPQNSGSFLASVVGKLFGQQASPQAQSSQGSPQQDPTQALQSQLYARRNTNIQGGMSAGQAQYDAAKELLGDPRYQDGPSQAILGRFIQDAIKNQGYDPKIQQQQQYQYQNYLNTKTGQRAALNPLQFSHLPDRQDWVKAENTPQIAPGRVQQNLENGKYVLRMTMPDGSQQVIGTSTSPMQFIMGTNRNLNLTGSDVGNHPSLADSFTTGGHSDINKENVAHQQVHVQNFDNIMGTVKNLLSQGAAGGKAGDYFEKIDDIIGSIGKFADTIGDTPDFTKYVKGKANMDQTSSMIGRFKLSGKQAIQLNTALNAAAYEWWRAGNPEGRLTPKELTEARDEIFGETADPMAALGGMETASRILHGNLQNTMRVQGVGPFGKAPPQQSVVPPMPDDIKALVSKYNGS